MIQRQCDPKEVSWSKDDYFTEKELAVILRMSPNTLQKNRSLGKGHPPFIKVGKMVLYPRKEFDAWIKSHRLIREIKAS